MYDIFERLLEEHGVTAYRVAKETGIPSSTFTEWKRGNYNPKQEKLKKIAVYFNVPLEYLMTGTSADQIISSCPPKMEKDIEKILLKTREQLLTQKGLMFDGKPASPEAIDSILAAMQIGMELAKQKNREKYTPKKYKKD